MRVSGAVDGKFHSRRKTPYDLFAVHHNNAWVVVDSRVPNMLVYEALREGTLPELMGYEEITMEPLLYGASRPDFLLRSKGEECLLKVKSYTLVEEGKALFPDAYSSYSATTR